MASMWWAKVCLAGNSGTYIIGTVYYIDTGILLIGISTVALRPSSNEGNKGIGQYWSAFRGHTILTSDQAFTLSSIPHLAHPYFRH